MKFSMIALAALPAVALAQGPTTTVTSTAVQTKTVTLSQVHTVTAYGQNNSTTTAYLPTGTGVVTPTTAVSDVPVVTKGPNSAGSALDASKIALAGVAGMLAVALM